MKKGHFNEKGELSKSTEQFDRTAKFAYYRQITKLQKYILISQDQVQVECYRKQPSGEWLSQCYKRGDTVAITSIEFQCPIEPIYDRVLRFIGA